MAFKKVLQCGISTAFAACVAAGSAFAVDIKANIRMSGDLARVEKEDSTGDKEYSYLLNKPVNQKDNPNDGLILEVDNGNAGARIAMWYKTAITASGDDGWPAYFRRSYVWFKPIDQLKLQLGHVGNDQHFKEKLDEWKVGSPFAATERDWSKHPVYVNCNDVEGWGFGLEYRPIESLIFNAGIIPGKKGSVSSDSNADTASFYNKEGDKKTLVAPWGVGARYFMNENFEFQASFRDGGMDSNRNGTWRVIRAGVGYKNEMTESFFQPILGLDYNTADEKWELNGMCLDMYGEVYIDSLTLYLHAPVTFRWSDAKTDLNYMEFAFKADYNIGSHGNLDDVKPYIQLGSNQGMADFAADGKVYKGAVPGVWLLDKHFGDSFNMSYKVGVDFMISGAEIDVGFQYDQLSDYYKKEFDKTYTFSIPFTVKFKNF